MLTLPSSILVASKFDAKMSNIEYRDAELVSMLEAASPLVFGS